MVVITVQNYQKARVYTITVKNKELFWVRMIGVQTGLGIKNMSDLVRREIPGIFGTKNPRKCIRTEQEITKKPTDILNLSMCVVIV